MVDAHVYVVPGHIGIVAVIFVQGIILEIAIIAVYSVLVPVIRINSNLWLLCIILWLHHVESSLSNTWDEAHLLHKGCRHDQSINRHISILLCEVYLRSINEPALEVIKLFAGVYQQVFPFGFFLREVPILAIPDQLMLRIFASLVILSCVLHQQQACNQQIKFHF